MLNICILTANPGYFEDQTSVKAAYSRLAGDNITFRSWTDTPDFEEFDLVLPLLAWGYQRDCPRWFAFLDEIDKHQVKTANPVSVLRWNSDKSYLLALAEAGIAIVPTLSSEALNQADLDAAIRMFGTEDLVVKPPVSAGADGTYRLKEARRLPDDIAGRRMLIQPFQPAVAREGEYSLFYFSGHFSHAILKRPAEGDFRVQDTFGGSETPIDCPVEARELAAQACQTVEKLLDIKPLLYARVDMLRDPDGMFRLMELELIEPALFLEHAPDKGTSFLKAISSLAN